jgi:hypothetical protein
VTGRRAGENQDGKRGETERGEADAAELHQRFLPLSCPGPSNGGML